MMNSKNVAGYFLYAALLAPTLMAGQQADWSQPVHGSKGFVKKFVTSVLYDQKDIWTSPLKINSHNAPLWILAGTTTASLIAADHSVSQALPFQGTSTKVGISLSKAGQWYSVFPAAGAVFAVGALHHNSKLRRTGLEALEAIADSDIAVSVIKVGARRQRPRDGDGGGHFEKGGSSFPSGHSTQAWALASVIADEYGSNRWMSFIAYGYATSMSVARVMAQDHFTSDVFVGGAIGFFVGRYVVGTQHSLRNGTALHSGLPRQIEWLRPTTITPSLIGGGTSISLVWIR